MDVRIGLTQTPKELEVHLEEGSDPAELRAQVDAAISGDGTLWLTDHKGRQFGVPASKLAYVEIGTSADDRRIGFGS